MIKTTAGNGHYVDYQFDFNQVSLFQVRTDGLRSFKDPSDCFGFVIDMQHVPAEKYKSSTPFLRFFDLGLRLCFEEKR